MLSFVSLSAKQKLVALLEMTISQISGLAMLGTGIWVQIGLHRYMELSTDYTNTFQIVLVGMGLIVLFVGTLACCCTVKAQSSFLYLVRSTDIIVGDEINYVIFISIPLASHLPSVQKLLSVCRIPHNHSSYRAGYCGELIHLQGPYCQRLAAGLKSKHQELRPGISKF